MSGHLLHGGGQLRYYGTDDNAVNRARIYASILEYCLDDDPVFVLGLAVDGTDTKGFEKVTGVVDSTDDIGIAGIYDEQHAAIISGPVAVVKDDRVTFISATLAQAAALRP